MTEILQQLLPICEYLYGIRVTRAFIAGNRSSKGTLWTLTPSKRATVQTNIAMTPIVMNGTFALILCPVTHYTTMIQITFMNLSSMQDREPV